MKRVKEEDGKKIFQVGWKEGDKDREKGERWIERAEVRKGKMREGV